ncbi:sulfite exporter TauE/SafE family protein [Alteromonas sediminis]|uniref:sulfite exporter TauE/SafE family protein n=1 Tax=Alteromonas sediminis TaxID=2259342 RepID=UPI001404CFC8|nr:sulfite exporter TauE/SafE family protein [Alteromonas sediminis]
MLTVIISAVLIGLSLGLLGAGGSILTVPMLAYGVGFSEKQAIVGGLFIVAAISLSTVLMNLRGGRIAFNAAAWLSVTGMLGSALAASASHWISGNLQFLLLAIIMLFAGRRMLAASNIEAQYKTSSRGRLFITGLLLGGTTGLVGVGGGFLIVPALVTLLNVPMRLAVNTSLTVIFFNASAGFGYHFFANPVLINQIDWQVLLIFTVVGIAGSFAGQFLAKKLPQHTLKKGFAWLILFIALGVLTHSLSQLFTGI